MTWKVQLGLSPANPFASPVRSTLSRAAGPESHGVSSAIYILGFFIAKKDFLARQNCKLITHIVIRYRQRGKKSAGYMWRDQAPEEAETVHRAFLPQAGTQAEGTRDGQITDLPDPRFYTPKAC